MLHSTDHTHYVLLCKRCDQTFTDAKSYREHNRTAEHLAGRLTERRGGAIRCRLCDFETSSREQMTKHRTTRHALQRALKCEVCGVTLPPTGMRSSAQRELARHEASRPHLNKVQELQQPGAVARTCGQ